MGGFHEVVDEIEQACIGPVKILEDEGHSALLGDALEEGAPGGKELLPASAGSVADPEQGKEAGLDPPPVFRIRHVFIEHRRDAPSNDGLIVTLCQTGPYADHLAEGPERHSIAVGRRAAVMPIDVLDE